MRSEAEPNGVCAARRPQLAKHAPFVHQATHISWPASFWGGRCARIALRMPPARIVIPVKSASGVGFSTRATGAREVSPPVRDDMVERAVS